ncbi:DUF5682 family protein, partial [Acinetobacter guillouiae]
MQLLDRNIERGEMPERLKQAFQLKQQMAEQNVFFAPIRHHSPACAYALKQYIDELKPTHILIEAPTSFEFLIESLQNQATQPPVAIFAQAQRSSNKTSPKKGAANKDSAGEEHESDDEVQP